MTEIITGVHCYMLITVLIFLFQISFRSYLMFSKLIQIASRGTFLHALVLCISICICNCIWSHFQTPCIAHHKMFYIILRELNVFDKNIKTNNHFYNILRIFEVLPNFFSPQVKRCAIITYKHGIYELSHELPNDLRLRTLEK